MKPIAFDGCRGWLHEATGTRGVVMCSALGLDEMSARQSWCVLADRLAAAGMPALRFDYRSTCDAIDVGVDEDRLAAWLADISAATRCLQSHCRITELVFVGVGFGATMAAAAAAAHGGVARLVLLAPPQSGRAYARELMLSAQVIQTEGGEIARQLGAGDDIDVAGFVTLRRHLDQFARLDLTKLDRKPAEKVLLARNPARPGQDAIAAHFTGLGADVTTSDFDDYDRLMIEPTNGHPCLATIDTVTSWLAVDAPLLGGAPIADTTAAMTAAAPAQQRADLIAQSTWREHAVQFGPGGHLVGILCQPSQPAPDRPAVVVVNSGRDSHTGWARGIVEMSRQFAADGVAVLRFDLSRIGDSQPDQSGLRIVLHSRTSLADIRAAIDLVRRHDYRRITLFGGCSGAYLALLVALTDKNINGLVLRNIQRFIWRPDHAFKVMFDEYFATANRRVTTGAVGSIIEQTNILSNKTSLRFKLSRACFRLARTSTSAASHALAIVGFQRWRLYRSLARYSARDGSVLMVYSANNSGCQTLSEIFGDHGRDLSALPGVAITFLDGADHNFTSAQSRRQLTALTREFVLAGARSTGTTAAKMNPAGLKAQAVSG